MLSHCPDNHAIILTGHTDFNYMKQAIRLVCSLPAQAHRRRGAGKKRWPPGQENPEEDKDFEQLKKGTSTAAELIALPRNVNNHVIDATIAFIADNYANRVGLQEAASYLELSESHLSRLFKEVTGLNFLQYLNAWRVNKSVELMKDPKKNIGEIATSCGFPTPGYFAKIFKRFTTKTPTQFRDELGSL
jgi:two-component system response regulator YesN